MEIDGTRYDGIYHMAKHEKHLKGEVIESSSSHPEEVFVQIGWYNRPAYGFGNRRSMKSCGQRVRSTLLARLQGFSLCVWRVSAHEASRLEHLALY